MGSKERGDVGRQICCVEEEWVRNLEAHKARTSPEAKMGSGKPSTPKGDVGGQTQKRLEALKANCQPFNEAGGKPRIDFVGLTCCGGQLAMTPKQSYLSIGINHSLLDLPVKMREKGNP